MADLGVNLINLLVMLILWAGAIALSLWLLGRLFPSVRMKGKPDKTESTETKVLKE